MPNTLTVTQAAQQIQTGRLAPLDLLDACLSHINALEGRVHAWASLDVEGAEAQAREQQEELARGRLRGALHGIPIAIKDIVYTRGLRTTAGSKILHDFIPEYDATVVSKLRDAGAVILGKTVTTEFACFDPPKTRNPWNLAHTPGGSSSGSAAAVACRMCPAALGSQTGGSISRPAAYCGIVGCKPTWGRVSVYGVHPVSFSLDHVGPLTRSVADAALLLRIIAGADPHDPLCSDAPVPDYPSGLAKPATRTPSIGLIRSYFQETGDHAVWSATEDAADIFRSNGADVTEIDLPRSFSDLHRMHRTIMFAEAAACHAARFKTRRSDYSPGIRSLLEEGLALSAVDYADARRHQLTFRSEIQAASTGVDLLLTPATLTPAPGDLTTTGDPAFNSPWSYTGLPTIVLPVKCTPDGLPIGIQLIGRPFAEPDLLTAAAWCESHLGWDKVPKLCTSPSHSREP